MTPWSPSAARELVRAEASRAQERGHLFIASALRRLPEAAFVDADAFAATLRAEELHSEALLLLAESSGAPRVSWRPSGHRFAEPQGCGWCGSFDHRTETCSDRRGVA